MKSMHNELIKAIYELMHHRKDIFFLSSDFGAPALDALRVTFKDRFINVGIAEQNLINLSAGLALEGFTVFAYGMAAFISTRAYEQIRTNLSLHACFKSLNVNIISVGAGLSYDKSGPTHHCLDDISLIRLLPNIELFSPCDWVTTKKLLGYCCDVSCPKYLRLDRYPQNALYAENNEYNFKKGYHQMASGRHGAIISTGIMTHNALHARQILQEKQIEFAVFDVFNLKTFDALSMYMAIKAYDFILTIEEGFTGLSGLDSCISNLLRMNNNQKTTFMSLGIKNAHIFELGRMDIHGKYGLSPEKIADKIIEVSKKNGCVNQR